VAQQARDVLPPDWLANATNLGQEVVDGFVCNVWVQQVRAGQWVQQVRALLAAGGPLWRSGCALRRGCRGASRRRARAVRAACSAPRRACPALPSPPTPNPTHPRPQGFVRYFEEEGSQRPVKWVLLETGAVFHVMDFSPGKQLGAAYWQVGGAPGPLHVLWQGHAGGCLLRGRRGRAARQAAAPRRRRAPTRLPASSQSPSCCWGNSSAASAREQQQHGAQAGAGGMGAEGGEVQEVAEWSGLPAKTALGLAWGGRGMAEE
jgi:hypothetical protein